MKVLFVCLCFWCNVQEMCLFLFFSETAFDGKLPFPSHRLWKKLKDESFVVVLAFCV